MKNCLLIGGEGYIGNIVANNLLQSGYSVTSFDNLIYGNNICVQKKLYYKDYRFIYGDMLDNEAVKPLVEEANIVVLLAGLVGDPITKKYPKESIMINDMGVKNIIDLCSENNVETFIFLSTCSNYGFIENDEIVDENHQLNPLSIYAKSKVKAENYILSLNGKTNMHPTILRFATAFGLSPRMRFDLTVSEFTRELAVGNELTVYDANTWRPYCHVQDFANLIIRVIESPTNKVSFEVFNVGGNANNATKKMITDYILKEIPNGRIRYDGDKKDKRNYKVSFEKVHSILGFEPVFSIKDGIKELVDAINNHVFDLVDENRNFFGNYEISYPIPS